MAVFCLAFAAVFYGLVKRSVGVGKEKREEREMFEMPVALEPAVDESPMEAMPLQAPEEEKKSRHEAAQAAIQKAQSPAESEAESETESKPEQESIGAKTEASLGAKKTAQTPAPQKTRDGLARFSSSALASVSMSPLTMDAYSRFGITLYVAGAAEKISNANYLTQPQRQDALKGQFELLGHAPEIAAGFALNIDAYLTNRKYLRMYISGRAAMAAQLENPADAPALGPSLVAALGAWSQPSPNQDAEDQGLVAVMFTNFTDRGDAVAKGRERGDDPAKEVLSVHNRIVRAALRQFGGEELKHTVDGTMAVFFDAANALEAAIQVQTGVAQFVQKKEGPENAGLENERPGLQVRIGIGAGEGVREGGDFLGTPVQLAASILDKAGPGEIVVSQALSEHCDGKEFGAEKIGDFELKDFKEAVPIYRVTHAPNHKFP